MALAYLLTFTTYGTWLHGVEKGSVDEFNNEFGSPLVEASPGRVSREQHKMDQPAFTMSHEEREVVCQAIVEIAAERNWNLLAAQVRSNHAHVVIAAEKAPERIMSDLKARASRNLTRAGYGTADRHRWTRHGSTRPLFKDEHVAAAIHYTLDEQGERMSWYEKEPPT